MIAIRKLGKAAKKKLKKYRQAEDAFMFHIEKNNPNHFVNPPKMTLAQAEKILSAKVKKR